jgi:hypothetical protein
MCVYVDHQPAPITAIRACFGMRFLSEIRFASPPTGGHHKNSRGRGTYRVGQNPAACIKTLLDQTNVGTAAPRFKQPTEAVRLRMYGIQTAYSCLRHRDFHVSRRSVYLIIHNRKSSEIGTIPDIVQAIIANAVGKRQKAESNETLVLTERGMATASISLHVMSRICYHASGMLVAQYMMGISHPSYRVLGSATSTTIS